MKLYCNRNYDELGDMGEPLAYLSFVFPDIQAHEDEALHPLPKFIRTVITVEPSNGRLLVNDGLTIKEYEVHCDGTWPKYDNATFRFHIHGEAIPYMRGKEVDAAIWADSEDNLIVSGCEAIGITTQFEEGDLTTRTDGEKPNFDAPNHHIKISDNSIESINDWFDAALESYYQSDSDEKPIARMYACEEYIMFQMMQKNDDGKMMPTGPRGYFPLDIYNLNALEVELFFIAPVLDLSMNEDFNGWLDIDLDEKSITTFGEYRQSIIRGVKP